MVEIVHFFEHRVHPTYVMDATLEQFLSFNQIQEHEISDKTICDKVIASGWLWRNSWFELHLGKMKTNKAKDVEVWLGFFE